jgi:GDP-L-fucose synthase
MSYVSKYSGDVIKDNSLMYLNLYESVSQVNPNIKIINPISNCSYPGIIDIQDEDNWWSGPIHHSVESYGTPKKLGFILSECYKNQYNVKTTNLIIPNSYGPEDYLDEERTHAMNGIIMRMIKSKNNKDNQFVIWGTGTPIREWIFMPDVARIIKQIVDENLFEKLPNPINLGQRHGISIKDTVQMVKNSLNYDVELVYDTTKTDGAPIKVLGNKLFNEYFPSFNFTSYEDGISNTINYYKKLL